MEQNIDFYTNCQQMIVICGQDNTGRIKKTIKIKWIIKVTFRRFILLPQNQNQDYFDSCLF